MSEVNNNAPTEESIQQSIEELGGIPLIELDLEVSGMTAYPTDKTLSIDGMAADAGAVGDKFNDVDADIAANGSAISTIQGWTGADIPLSSDDGAPSIKDAIDAFGVNPYPVGSVYMTTSDSAPSFIGTWVEIAITATWAQLKTGKRGYAELEEGDIGGAVHFWMRTA